MKIITALVIILFTLGTASAAAQRSFATEAEVTFDQATGLYLVIARVSELIMEQDETVETLIAAPRMTVVPGKRAAITDGPSSDGTSVRADVFWPEPGSDVPASIVITLRSDGKVINRSKFTLDLKKG
jgi:hypothetical protein